MNILSRSGRHIPRQDPQEGILVEEDEITPLIDENGDPVTEYNYYFPKELPVG